MNIYVDETFIENRTIISAVKISNKKIKEAIYKIKAINKCPKNKILKGTKIRMNANKGTINSTISIINKKSKWTKIEIIIAKQHSKEFYIGYGKFLRELNISCPSANIIVDNFNGIHEIPNYKMYTFMKSSTSEGIQIADMFLTDKRK